MELETLFSPELTSLLLYIQNDMIKDHPTLEITPNYFLLAAIKHRTNRLYSVFTKNLTSYSVSILEHNYVEQITPKLITALRPNYKPKYSSDFGDLVNKSNQIREELNMKYITSDLMCYTMFKIDKFAEVIKKLPSLGISENILETVIKESDTVAPISQTNSKAYPKVNINTNVKSGGIPFCIDLLQLTKQTKKRTPLYGRKNEIDYIFNVLSRKTKANVLMVGENGVGKTAIINKLCYQVIDKECSPTFHKLPIYSLDLSKFINGMMGGMPGMLELNLNTAFNDIKTKLRAGTLVIENFHVLCLSDIFLPLFQNISEVLESGDIKIIATTTPKAYVKYVEQNPFALKFFETLNINKFSIEDTIELLNLKKSYLESYHKVFYTKDVIKRCILLADKYITSTSLADASYDILDGVGAMVKINRELNIGLLNKFSTLDDLQKKVSKITEGEEVETMKDKIASTMIDIIATENSIAEKQDVTIDDVMVFFEKKMDMPLNNIRVDEKESLLHIEDKIKSNVIGQAEAINKICKTIKRSKVGLGIPNKPIGSFLMVGKSGVGKTLVAKEIAKELFGDEKYLVRLDMGEYSEKTSVTKLFGSSPGYIGFDEGGQLTEIIKNKKHCVLLLDEIEKSCQEVFNAFLAILDEGKMTDNKGNVINFNDVVIIMTSNIGVKKAKSLGVSIGFNVDNAPTINKENTLIEKELKEHFPIEFINRLDDVIFFNDLSDDDMCQIIKLELNKLCKRVELLGHNISFSQDTPQLIFEELKLLKKNTEGARPITRFLQSLYEDKIVENLLSTDDFLSIEIVGKELNFLPKTL